MNSIGLPNSGLIVVDAQRGFTELCPDELPIPGALAITPRINALLELPWARIDASQDWHPPDHCSFVGQRGNLYPPHCVMGTPGADFLPALRTERFHAIWRKGFQQDRDAYGVTEQHPEIVDLLRSKGVTTIVVCGLASNVCCFFTARDLRNAGFRVLLAEDASAGIDVPDAKLYQEKAKREGESLGIEYVQTSDVLSAIVG